LPIRSDFGHNHRCMKHAKALILQRLLEMLADALLVLAAFLLAYFARIGQFTSTDFPFAPYFELALWFVPVFLGLLMWFGMYALREKGYGELLRICINVALIGALLFPLIFFFKREIFFSRLIPVYIWLFAVLLLFGFHAGLRLLADARHRRGSGALRTLVIGNGRAAADVIRRLRQTGSRLQPVAILAPYGGGAKVIEGAPVVGKLDALERTVENERIEAIVQTEAGEQTLNLLTFAEGKYLEYLLAPEVLGAFRQNLVPAQVAGRSFLRHRISPLFGWGQLWKRMLDIIVATVVLLLGSPLFAGRKIGTRLMATGPDAAVFWKYEFKSATGWLRYFPEFLNVFYGEMSLVGPRPRSPKERDALSLHERRRLVVKPGIFGPWQLERLRGSADPHDLAREVELDTRYIFTWSFGKDLLLLLRSALALFTRKA